MNFKKYLSFFRLTQYIFCYFVYYILHITYNYIHTAQNCFNEKILLLLFSILTKTPQTSCLTINIVSIFSDWSAILQSRVGNFIQI